MSRPGSAWWDDVRTAEGLLELRVRRVEGGVRLVVDGVEALDVVIPVEAAAHLGAALAAAAGSDTAAEATAAGMGVTSVAGASVVPDSGVAPSSRGAPPTPGSADVVRERRAPAPWLDAPPTADEAVSALGDLLHHLRRLCEVLPETAEIDTLGDPTFRVATRIFAVVETIDAVPVLRFKATLDEQAALLVESRFRADPDTGHHGWTSLRADCVIHGGELDRLVLSSYRLVAPPEAVVRLDDALGAAVAEGEGPGLPDDV